MGYDINLGFGEVKIPRANFQKLTKAINKWRAKNRTGKRLDIDGTDGSLKKAFDEHACFDVEINKKGLTVESFNADRYFDEMEEWTDLIAPFVTGGTIFGSGEDKGDEWEWVYESGQRIEFRPTILWENKMTYHIQGAN